MIFQDDDVEDAMDQGLFMDGTTPPVLCHRVEDSNLIKDMTVVSTILLFDDHSPIIIII